MSAQPIFAPRSGSPMVGWGSMGALLANQPASSDGRGRLPADTAYEYSKRDIVRCTLEPGRQVTEEELADRYRVGRAAVRAALKRLYQEQLIEIMTRQRYMIAPITLKHVNELFDLLIGVLTAEVSAKTWAALSATRPA